MEDLLCQVASKEGFYALLFVSLLLYVLKTNATREANYQAVIKHITETLGVKFDELQKTINDFTRR